MVQKSRYVQERIIMKNPGQEGGQIIKGIRPLMEAIEAGREIEKVLIQKGLAGNLIKDLVKLLSDHKIPFQTVPVEKLNRVVRENHQGVLAYVSRIIYSSLDNILSTAFQEGRDPMIIVLDRITDVRNFGAIARTAEGLGFDALVIPSNGSAQINEDAMKTSAGALNHIPTCREQNLNNTLKYLKESGLQVVACTEKAGKSIYELELTGPIALIFGSEEDGISSSLLRYSDFLAKIPMAGKVASFNVSVSVGMIAAEVVRQRGI
jgi:23S rRNA (guanosine2251-2'-O)-methyltransferase